MADDFDARWRAAAHANPGRCTYPEAVPGYRASSATQRRTRPAEGPRKRETDPDALRATEPITRTDRDTGGMIVHWPTPEPDVPPVDAPVTVDEIRQAVRGLATDDAVQALADAIAKADQPRLPWWVRIVDRVDEALCQARRWWWR